MPAPVRPPPLPPHSGLEDYESPRKPQRIGEWLDWTSLGYVGIGLFLIFLTIVCAFPHLLFSLLGGLGASDWDWPNGAF